MYCRFPRRDASIRIFCFPWAGGGGSFYNAWGKDITDEAEVHSLCLPGREQRYKDPIDYTFQQVLDYIVNTVHRDYGNKPFIFMGHSMGGLLAFFAACKLKELYGKEPEHMIMSSTTAPHSPIRVIEDVRKLSQEEFKEKLRKLGGTPQDVLDNSELMDLILPAMKRDYEIIADMLYTHNPDAPPPLTCPIDFFDGEEDKDHDMTAWKQVTSGSFTVHKMPGGHFFLKDAENTQKLINFINRYVVEKM